MTDFLPECILDCGIDFTSGSLTSADWARLIAVLFLDLKDDMTYLLITAPGKLG